MSERERMTAALVKDLGLLGLVEWIHALQDHGEAMEARVTELEADPRMALTLDELEALVTGYGFWWRGPDETRSPSPLTDKAVTVLERMRAALAAEGKEEPHGDDG